MSKMTKPEMSVVRFQESDVIVASLYLMNFNNGESSDATATYKGVTYNYGNKEDLKKKLPNDSVMSSITGEEHSIGDMFWSELNPESQYNARTDDGWYVFNPTKGYWTWSHQ